MPTLQDNIKPGLRRTLRALRHRNFRLFFSGQFISLVGTWMQTIAENWLVYRLTGSSVLLGVIAFVSQIPAFLLAPIAGVAADRLNRRRLIIVTQAASMVLAFVFAGLTLTGLIEVWQIVVLALLLGVVNAFDIPARQAFLMDMVGREDLLNAVALNSSLFNSARIIGPAIAGILVASIGEGWCFFANGASYIAVIAGLFMIRSLPRQGTERRDSPLQEILEGWGFAHRTVPIRALLLLVGLISFAAMPYTVLMPVYAGRVLGGGARELGWLMGATGVGALAGALALAARETVRGLGTWVWIAATIFGATLIVFPWSSKLWLAIAMLVPAGFAMMIQFGSTNTLLQVMVPDRLRGRVMALYAMMFIGMGPIGALVAGLVADRIGVQWAITLGGLACVAGGAIFARQLPSLRPQARQLIDAQGMMVGDARQSVPLEPPPA